MLTKLDIITILKDEHLPLEEYWITSGAGMVLHGTKEFTRDIDLGCTTALIEFLIDEGYPCKLASDHARTVTVGNYIEVFENWCVDEIIYVDGLPLATLESIKKQKEVLGRDKDFLDIKLIDEFLLNQQ
jgi:hypothetical protein